MKVLLIATLLSLSLSLLEGKPTRNEEWKAFLVRHSKSYDAATEAFRRTVWELRKDAIDKHNAKADRGLETYYMEENKFTDLTVEELATYSKTKDPSEGIEGAPIFTSFSNRHLHVPSSVNYTQDPCMPKVKDQAKCGSCWAFGATNPVEFQNCKKNGALVLLSEQQLVDCTCDGCGGGSATDAWKYIINVGGQEQSSEYPYNAQDNECHFEQQKVKVKILSYTRVEKMNEISLRDAVSQKGPVTVSIEVIASFHSYKSGIYSDPTCPNDGVTHNHSVVVVGYGTDSATKLDYWIVRNSWGDDWGESGYVRIIRGVNMCNIASNAAFPAVM